MRLGICRQGLRSSPPLCFKSLCSSCLCTNCCRRERRCTTMLCHSLARSFHTHYRPFTVLKCTHQQQLFHSPTLFPAWNCRHFCTTRPAVTCLTSTLCIPTACTQSHPSNYHLKLISSAVLLIVCVCWGEEGEN